MTLTPLAILLPDGFVGFASRGHWPIDGAGDDEAAVRAEVRSNCGPFEIEGEDGRERAMTDEEINAQIVTLPATAALLDAVRARGGAIDLGIVDGIACTPAEASAVEILRDPDEPAHWILDREDVADPDCDARRFQADDVAGLVGGLRARLDDGTEVLFLPAIGRGAYVGNGDATWIDAGSLRQAMARAVLGSAVAA